MWYEAAWRQQGVLKSIDLDISCAPHCENPDKAVKQMRRMLAQFIGNSRNGQ